MNSNYRILNNNDYASDFRQKINDNFADLFKNNVPTNHASQTDAYGLGTNNVYGHVKINQANGLSVASGTISMSQATTAAFGTVKLASTSSSTSATDVVTSKVLNSALRGQSTMPRIFYGTTDPSSTNPSGSQNGDIYIKYS